MQHLLGFLSTPESLFHHHRQQRPSKHGHFWSSQTSAAAPSFWIALTRHSSALSTLLTFPFSLSLQCTRNSQDCFSCDHPVILPASAVLHSGHDMFLYSGTNPSAHMMCSGLSGVYRCLLCPSLTSSTEEQAPLMNRWMCFCHVALDIQS